MFKTFPPIPLFARAALAALVAITALPVAMAQADTAARAVSGFNHPESVAIDGPRRFVSNIGAKLDPLGHDGDGYISELDADGVVVAANAFPDARLDAPKGMTILDGRLYVADIDRVVGFDLSTRQQVFEAFGPEGSPSLLNDMAATPMGLLVSDTLRGVLYRIDVDTGVFTILADGMPGANGMAWGAKEQRLLVVALGAKFEGGDVYAVTPAGAVRRLDNSLHGIFDGVAVLPDGTMIISDWRSIDPPVAGSIMRYDAEGAMLAPVETGKPIQGPADFALDADGGVLWIPAMLEGEIRIVPVKP